MADASNRQRAKLRQAIAILQTLLGQPVCKNQTLTDVIIDFVRAKDEYFTVIMI
jgi:hypothetical protein